MRKGRLILDEPTDLPEGEVVDLVLLDDVLVKANDDLDDAERQLLHDEIQSLLGRSGSGQLADAD